MATLTINSWKIVPLNPDGTDNAFLNSYTGSVPAVEAEEINWLCMGANVRLEFDCTIAGTYADSSTADIIGSTIRYNPALFLEYMGVWYPPGTFPQGGYSIQIPSAYASSYAMALIGQNEQIYCNTNGDVEIALNSDTEFVITHTLRLTADVESYIQGTFVPNYYRLSKNSIFNNEEQNLDRPSVYGNRKGLNVMIGMKQRTFTLFAFNLSIPFAASFDGYESNGDLSVLVDSYTITRNGDVFDELSPFEDNLVTFSFVDTGAIIIEDESEVILVNRDLDQNINTFPVDFQLAEGKLITSGVSSQIDGAIYAPVAWSQAAGVTEISFIIRGSELVKSGKYQIHLKIATQGAPSDTQLTHFMTDVIDANAAPPEVVFNMESLFYSRNRYNGTVFSIAPAQRLTNVISLDKSQYNTSASSLDPWINFDTDIKSANVKILDSDGEILFESEISYSPTAGWETSDYIGTEQVVGSSVVRYFWLKEFRVPFTNYQSLPDWINQDYTVKWSIYFEDSTDSNYGAYYTQESTLQVGDWQNEEPSPYITDIELYDMDWNPLSDWSSATQIRVVAYLPYADANTYVSVMVDKYPLGVGLFNEYALEEEDPTAPTTPSYVIFEQLATDLLIDVPDQPEDNYIAFILDVSELDGQVEYYIYIESFQYV